MSANSTQVGFRISRIMIMLLLVFGLLPDSYSGSDDPVPVKPRNVILMIGDGFGLPQAALMQYRIKSGRPFYLDSFPVVGLQKTHSLYHVITDSGAAATSMSTGVKTYNNAVGVGPDTLPTVTRTAEAGILNTWFSA